MADGEASRERLVSLSIEGFRSIRKADLAIGPVTVLVGANGSGKTNLLLFLEMLSYAMAERLAVFVGEHGGSNALQHNGSEATPRLRATIECLSELGSSRYRVSLSDAAEGTLIFSEECLEHRAPGAATPYSRQLDVGRRESEVPKLADVAGNADLHAAATVVRDRLRGMRVFHFHNTSRRAAMRKPGPVDQDRALRPDGANLAAYLATLAKYAPQHLRRIEEEVRAAVADFREFDLAERGGEVRLSYLGLDPYYALQPSQWSDGSLRFAALATLLLQPARHMPSLIAIDEPELGLHPSAVRRVARMVRAASEYTQVLVATQSPTLLREFEADEVIVVRHDGGSSQFERLDPEELGMWVEEFGDYGELFERSIIGGSA